MRLQVPLIMGRIMKAPTDLPSKEEQLWRKESEPVKANPHRLQSMRGMGAEV